MSRTQESDERIAKTSHTRIQELAHHVWSTRAEAVRVLNRESAADLPRGTKADLHAAVFEYLNLLRPYFIHHSNKKTGIERVQEIWEEEPAISAGPLEVDMIFCPECEEWQAPKAQTEVTRADECPECGVIGLQEMTVEHPTQQSYAPLKVAQNQFLDVEQREVTKGNYLATKQTETEVKMLPVQTLIHISRLLDEAARELGFLPQGKENESLPKDNL